MGISKHILWSPLAEEDLNNIPGYLEKEWNQQVVLNFINALENNINRIVLHSEGFPLINTHLKIRKSVLT